MADAHLLVGEEMPELIPDYEDYNDLTVDELFCSSSDHSSSDILESDQFSDLSTIDAI